MLTLPSKTLAAICSGFNKIIPRNSAIPVLRYVLVHPGGLLVTNLEESLEYRCGGAESPFLIGFDDLKRLSKGLSKTGTITLSLGDGCVEAVVDDDQRMTQSLDTLSVDEFPLDNPDGDFTDLNIRAFLDGFQQIEV